MAKEAFAEGRLVAHERDFGQGIGFDGAGNLDRRVPSVLLVGDEAPERDLRGIDRDIDDDAVRLDVFDFLDPGFDFALAVPRGIVVGVFAKVALGPGSRKGRDVLRLFDVDEMAVLFFELVVAILGHLDFFVHLLSSFLSRGL